jgi:poly(3-hydroxybutyrate) depolymerase
MRPWKPLADHHGFIVACPDLITATNHLKGTSNLPPFVEDEEVLLSIVETIRSAFRVNPRAVMITGFSGGGNQCYWSGLRHPEIFTHICPRGGNFAPQEVPADEEVLKAGRDHLRIFIFYGEHDHPLILGSEGNPGQAQMAFDALTKAGYRHLAIEKVPGMKHESRPKKAAEWFAEYVKANRKRFAAGDEVDELIDKARGAIENEDYRDAGRSLEKALDIEEKNDLASRAKAVIEKLDAIGQARIEEARKAHASGDIATAKGIIGKVARDFRGLPSGEKAAALSKEWKK